MKTSTKIVLAAASVGALSLGVQLRTVYAIKPQAHEAIMPQTHSSNLVAEASDGDGEENDATEAPELVVKKAHSRSTSSIPIKVQKANKGIERQNDAKKALERTVTNSDSNKDDGGFDAPNDADSTHEDAH